MRPLSVPVPLQSGQRRAAGRATQPADVGTCAGQNATHPNFANETDHLLYNHLIADQLPLEEEERVK